MLLNKEKDLHRQDQELKSKMPVQKQIFLQLVPQYVKNRYKYAAAVNNEYDSIIEFLLYLKIRILLLFVFYIGIK